MYDGFDTHIEYVIQCEVRPVIQTHRWVVKRRYRNFKELDDKIAVNKVYGKEGPSKPSLPGKRMFRQFGHKYVQKKTLNLDRYLQTLIVNENVIAHDEFLQFITDSATPCEVQAGRRNSSIPANGSGGGSGGGGGGGGGGMGGVRGSEGDTSATNVGGVGAGGGVALSPRVRLDQVKEAAERQISDELTILSRAAAAEAETKNRDGAGTQGGLTASNLTGRLGVRSPRSREVSDLSVSSACSEVRLGVLCVFSVCFITVTVNAAITSLFLASLPGISSTPSSTHASTPYAPTHHHPPTTELDVGADRTPVSVSVVVVVTATERGQSYTGCVEWGPASGPVDIQQSRAFDGMC